MTVATTIYRCTFERIGRTRDVAPQDFAAPDADALAGIVFNFARKYLMSSDVDVVVNLEEGKGTIYAGMHTGGTFTIEEVTA